MMLTDLELLLIVVLAVELIIGILMATTVIPAAALWRIKRDLARGGEGRIAPVIQLGSELFLSQFVAASPDGKLSPTPVGLKLMGALSSGAGAAMGFDPNRKLPFIGITVGDAMMLAQLARSLGVDLGGIGGRFTEGFASKALEVTGVEALSRGGV